MTDTWSVIGPSLIKQEPVASCIYAALLQLCNNFVLPLPPYGSLLLCTLISMKGLSGPLVINHIMMKKI